MPCWRTFPPAQLTKLDALLTLDPAVKATPLAWLRNAPTAPKPDHVRALLDRLRRVREIGVPAETAGRIHEDRFHQLVREGRISDAHQMGRYTVQRRRAILIASVIDLEARLTDAALDMADKLIGGLFARAGKARERRYVAGTKNVARLMRLFHDTIEALDAALNSERDAFTVVDETVGWAKLLRVQGEVKELADLAERRPAAGRCGPLPDAAQVRARPDRGAGIQGGARHDPTLAAIRLLRDLNRSGKRDIPAGRAHAVPQGLEAADFRGRIGQTGGSTKPPCSRHCATSCAPAMSGSSDRPTIGVSTATCCRRRRCRRSRPSWVCRATADEWLAKRGAELDRRLKRFARRLRRGELEGVELRDGRLHVAPVKATTPPEAEALAAAIDAMLPPVRITELLHEVSRANRLLRRFHQSAHRRALATTRTRCSPPSWPMQPISG